MLVSGSVLFPGDCGVHSFGPRIRVLLVIPILFLHAEFLHDSLVLSRQLT